MAQQTQRERMMAGGSPYPWKRWDVILATIALNLFSLIIPIMIFQLYDRIIPNQSYSTLAVLAIGVGIAAILEAVIRSSRAHILTWLGLHYEHATTISAFNHFLHSRVDDVARAGVGEHVENIESSGILKEFLAGPGFLALLDLPFVFLFLGIIAFFSPHVAIGAFIIMVGFVIGAIILGYKLRRLLERHIDVNDRRYNFIVELFANHHTLKSMGMEDLLIRRYERIHATCSRNQYEINYASEEARDLASTFSYIMFIGIAGLAAWEVLQEHQTVGIMGAAIVLTNRILQPVQAAMGMWTRFQHFIIARQRMKEHFGLGQESTVEPSEQKISEGSVSIKNLKFHYERTDKTIFQDLTLNVSGGQTVTIHGKNGAGKTTLMLLIMGNLIPDKGEVSIDGTPLHQIHHKELRRNMVYLPPKGILFQGTILENMTVLRTGSIVEEALLLSRRLGLDEWVRRLPLGYDTKVGDSLFMLLPDGIHQRICLVRALVSRPKILILDEANTSLDDSGDQLLRDVLFSLKGQMTIIFVTHRPSVRQLADKSYDLIDGRLEEHKKGELVYSPAAEESDAEDLQNGRI